MELNTFTPPVREDGDRVPAKEMVGRPLVVQVREHRTGVKTQYNSDPNDAKRYKPEGGDAVLLDMADLSTGAVYIGVLWFNGAIVDSFKAYVASVLPVKLFYDTPKSGTNPYLNVEPLTGAELASAQQWAATNPHTFESERAARQQQNTAAAPATGGMAPIPGAPSTPPAWLPPTGQQAPPPLAPAAPPAPVAPAANTGGVNVNDPAIQALLAQIAGQQQGR